MTATTYANTITNVQSVIYGIVNSAVGSTAKVLNGTPETLTRGTGFPYVLVRTPLVPENNLTLNKKMIRVTIPIEIWSKKETVVMSLADSIRTALDAAVATTFGVLIHHYLVESSNTAQSFLPDENSSAVWTMVLNVHYDVMCSVGV